MDSKYFKSIVFIYQNNLKSKDFPSFKNCNFIKKFKHRLLKTQVIYSELSFFSRFSLKNFLEILSLIIKKLNYLFNLNL